MPIYPAMRFATTSLISLLIAFLFSHCQSQPDAEAVYTSLKDGEAKFIVTMDDEAFYPDDSRFKGSVTISPTTIHLDLFDQFESNVILSLSNTNLFVSKPVKQSIDVHYQSAGSVLIGRVRDKKQRTGDGFLMSAGDVTVVAVSAQKLIIRLSGMTGNFNTLNDEKSWKKLEGLLVYKRPTITMRGGATSALLYE